MWTVEQRESAIDLWERLVIWFRSYCPAEGFVFRRLPGNEVEIRSMDGRSMRLSFDPDSRHSQLEYELEDGTRREAGILVTSYGHADFRRDGVSYSPKTFGKRLVGELLEERI